MKNSCMFCGHRNIENTLDKNKISEIFTYLIEKENITNFISGGMGNFDMLCENCILELKLVYPNIKLFLIIPYHSKYIDNNPNYYNERYDEIILPLSNVHYKYAIPKRNRWMVDECQYMLAYIRHSWGGAFKTHEYAKKQNTNIIYV